MKRFSVLLLAILLIIGTVWAKSTRVKFPPGRTTVVLNGRTTGGPSESGGMDPVGYILRANKGQTMTLHLTSAKEECPCSGCTRREWIWSKERRSVARLERRTAQDRRLRDHCFSRRRENRYDVHDRR